MGQSLSARQRSALGAGATLADVEKVLADSRTALTETAAEHDRQKARSLDPHVDAKDAREARHAASDAEHDRDRHKAAIEKLERKVQALKDRDEKAKRDLELAAAIEERDLLVADLRRCGPKIIKQWVELCTRIRKSDERLTKLSVRQQDGHAEQIARGVPGNFYVGNSAIRRLTKAEIPNWDGAGLAWPPPQKDYIVRAWEAAEANVAAHKANERAAEEAAEEASWRPFLAVSQKPSGDQIQTRTGTVHVRYEPVRVELNPRFIGAAYAACVELTPLPKPSPPSAMGQS